MHAMLDVYQLETVEQLRVFADALRQRILEALSGRPLTAKQLATLLREPPARVHYHVRELERVGLVRLVETREKKGILEKYYSAVARNFSIPATLLRTLPADEQVQEMGLLLSRVTQGFLDAFASSQGRSDPGTCSLSVSSVWLTADEYDRLVRELGELLERYAHGEREGDRREYTLGLVAYLSGETIREEVGTANDGPSSGRVRNSQHPTRHAPGS